MKYVFYILYCFSEVFRFLIYSKTSLIRSNRERTLDQISGSPNYRSAIYQ
jgi:hypothetical protein